MSGSKFNDAIDGVRIPITTFKSSDALAKSASDFAEPVQLNTGKAESEWLGSLLIYLSAQGGTWQGVPWRMVRNAYMSYGEARRFELRDDRRLPITLAREPAVTYTLGGETPVEELLIGYSDMMRRQLAGIFSGHLDDFLYPTNRLLKCASRPSAGADSCMLGPVFDLARLS